MWQQIRIYYATLKIIVVFCIKLLTAVFRWLKIHTSAEQTAAQETQDKPILLLTLNNAKELQMNTTQNIAGNTNILANALHSANMAQLEKASKPTPLLVPRQDLLGQRALFFAETQDRVKDTVDYWDGKKGSKIVTVPMAFYKATKAIEDDEQRKKLVQDYSKEFGVKEFILRQRLIKNGAGPERDEQGQVEKIDFEAYKLKLVAAITKAIMES